MAKRPKWIRNHIQPKRPVIDGIRFDSASEGHRYGELSLLERMGQISDLSVHYKLPLVVNGKKITPSGKFTIDFRYKEKGKWVYEDAKPADKRGKPMMTEVSKLKIALCEAIHDIKINCIAVRRS